MAVEHSSSQTQNPVDYSVRTNTSSDADDPDVISSPLSGCPDFEQSSGFASTARGLRTRHAATPRRTKVTVLNLLTNVRYLCHT